MQARKSDIVDNNNNSISVLLPRRVRSWGCLGGELQNPPMPVMLQPRRVSLVPLSPSLQATLGGALRV